MSTNKYNSNLALNNLISPDLLIKYSLLRNLLTVGTALQNGAEFFTPQYLALFFMDSGHWRSPSSLIFYTSSFSIKGLNLLYKITVKIQFRKTRPNTSALIITGNSALKFKNIISPFVLKPFEHKLKQQYVKIKNSFILTQDQKDLIFGTCLGDAFLSTRKGINWYYETTHTVKQQDYLFLKYEILKSFCKRVPWLYKRESIKGNSRFYDYYRFMTTSQSFLSFYGNIFYTFDNFKQSWVRDVPVLAVLKEHLTPRAIAYWYMDDGTLSGDSGCIFCTDSFSLSGIARLKLIFKEKYNISINLRKILPANYRIYINSENCKLFVPLIKPYLLTSMLYKLPKKYR